MNKPAEFTPSNLVLLKAMPTRRRDVDGVVRVLVDNPPDQIVRQAVATAFLANEEAGLLRLEVACRRAFFGLVKKDVIQTAKVTELASWPEGCLERSLLGFVPSVRVAVSDVVSDWIGVTSDHPHRLVIGRVKEDMAAMGVLDLVMSRKRVLRLFSFTQTNFVLPPWTEGVIERQPAPHLLEVCLNSRPELCHLLHKEVEHGFYLRTAGD